jgi:hypothetical protein
MAYHSRRTVHAAFRASLGATARTGDAGRWHGTIAMFEPTQIGANRKSGPDLVQDLRSMGTRKITRI